MDLYVRNLYLDKIRGFYNADDIIKVITGVRRSGKSSIMELAAQEIRAAGTPSEHIVFLDLSHNALTALPESFSQLRMLRRLSLARDAFRHSAVGREEAAVAPQRSPRLNRHTVQAAVREDAVVSVNCKAVVRVEEKARVNHILMIESELKLIGENRLRDVFFEQFRLHRIKIGHAEMAHKSPALQIVKRLGNLIAVHQHVGSVKTEHVDIIKPHTPQ